MKTEACRPLFRKAKSLSYDWQLKWMSNEQLSVEYVELLLL